MAGEFHHNLGGDANGEHKADEGLAAAVGADLGDTGVDFNAGVAGFVLVVLGYALFLPVPRR